MRCLLRAEASSAQEHPTPFFPVANRPRYGEIAVAEIQAPGGGGQTATDCGMEPMAHREKHSSFDSKVTANRPDMSGQRRTPRQRRSTYIRDLWISLDMSGRHSERLLISCSDRFCATMDAMDRPTPK
jgi:hypothetical protein